MAGSLFDQLKKSGLVDEKKARKVKQQQHQQNKKNRANKTKKGQTVVSEASKLAAKAAEDTAERNRLLNQQRQQEQAQKALQAEVKQIIESNQLKDFDGERVYNFADGKKVKSLSVNEKTLRGLSSEKLRIARFNNGYALVTSEAAEKIEQRDKSILISTSGVDDSLSKEDQDYYAQFEIPDDLVW